MTFFGTTFVSYVRTVYTERQEPEYAHAFADFYWSLLLGSACIAVVLICVYSAWQLTKVASTPVVHASATSTTTSSAFNRVMLEATLSGFEQRAENFQTLETSPIQSIADPSH